MIEVEEVTKKKEQATEVDVRLMFDALFKPIEALQKMIAAEAQRLGDNNVDTSRVEVEISPNMISVRIGDIVLYHEIKVYVYDFSK